VNSTEHSFAREFVREQWLPRKLDGVFAFFSNAYNLEQITPPFLRFRVVRISNPEIRAGTLIDYRLSLHGVPFRWRTRIQRWQAPDCFVDTQVRGPYKSWHHTHEFVEQDGGTLVRDRVRYELPLGRWGRVIAGDWVARDVARIFDFRRRRIAELFGGEGTRPNLPGEVKR
jgi:ligand-binding SRPBCC domain-containing protein